MNGAGHRSNALPIKGDLKVDAPFFSSRVVCGENTPYRPKEFLV